VTLGSSLVPPATAVTTEAEAEASATAATVPPRGSAASDPAEAGPVAVPDRGAEATRGRADATAVASRADAVVPDGAEAIAAVTTSKPAQRFLGARDVGFSVAVQIGVIFDIGDSRRTTTQHWSSHHGEKNRETTEKISLVHTSSFTLVNQPLRAHRSRPAIRPDSGCVEQNKATSRSPASKELSGARTAIVVIDSSNNVYPTSLLQSAEISGWSPD
jgi:hypothetical protein